MKDPAMLFYTSDFLTGVQLMSMKERGQYITLLCLQQQRGHMTEREMTKAVGKLSPELRSKFITDDDGKLYNKRAEHEIQRREAHSKRQSQNIAARWNKQNGGSGTTSGNTVVLPLETEIEIETEIERVIKDDKSSKGNINTSIMRFIPPSIEEVTAYCKERGNAVDPHQFIDHYTANGWHVGKQKMRDWRAAVRTWERYPDWNKKGKREPTSKDILRMIEEGEFDD